MKTIEEKTALPQDAMANLEHAADLAAIGKFAEAIWTASELLQFPRSIQEAVLREQSTRLLARYRQDPQLSEPFRWWTASEVGRLPLDLRNTILETSAIVAEEEYRTNPDLTAFDAFGEDDLYADSTSSEPRPRQSPSTDAR